MFKEWVLGDDPTREATERWRKICPAGDPCVLQGAGHPITVAVSHGRRTGTCLHTRFADDDVLHRPAPLPRQATSISAHHRRRGEHHGGRPRFTRARLPRGERRNSADIVRTSNITFVGPSGDQIRQMGGQGRRPQAGAEAQGGPRCRVSGPGRGRGRRAEDRRRNSALFPPV